MSHKNRNAVNPAKPKRIAIVISNPSISTTSGWPVGFWWSELSHPYYKLTEIGHEVEIFSYFGGRCEADPSVGAHRATCGQTRDGTDHSQEPVRQDLADRAQERGRLDTGCP